MVAGGAVLLKKEGDAGGWRWRRSRRATVQSEGGSAGVTILRGRGDGTFIEDGAVGVGCDSGATGVAACDGAVVLDLAVANQYDSVSVLLGRGDGTFAAERRFRVSGSYPSGV